MPIQELAAFVGRWELAVDLPGAEDVWGDVTFEMMGELLIERSVIPVPEAPDSYGIVMDQAGGDWARDFRLTYRRIAGAH